MKEKSIGEELRHEAKLARGEETKAVTFRSSTTYADESKAKEAFSQSVGKLLNVNKWSELSEFAADFTLYSPEGEAKPAGPVAAGDHIRIDLPGLLPTNWVCVTDQNVQDDRAEFTVQPCQAPDESPTARTDHFFTQEARSTFRVERIGSTIHASELGSNERINNQGPEAGNRAVANTLIAETAWLFYQKIQWQLLTDYLVHR